MKKTTIAISIAATLIAGVTNAAEIYNQNGTVFALGGDVEARLLTQDSKVSDSSITSIHLLGKTKLQNNFYGVGYYEAEFKAGNESGNIDNNHIYAGIGHNTYGLITYGENDGALGMLTDFTGLGANFTGVASAKLKVADREKNMITYVGDFDNLIVKANYHFSNSNKHDGVGQSGKVTSDHTNGYSMGVTYAVNSTGINLGAGMAHQSVSDDSNALTKELNNQTQFIITGSYEINSLYFATLYTHINNKNYDVLGSTKVSGSYNGYEFAARYTLNDSVNFNTTYNIAKTNKVNTVNQITAEVNYIFNANLNSYIDYSFNLLSEKDAGSKIASEDLAMLGLKYTF